MGKSRFLKHIKLPLRYGMQPSTVNTGIYDPDDNIVAEIGHLGWIDNRQSEVSAEQDRLGNLFAAAPDLYDALEKVLEIGILDAGDHVLGATRERVIAALKKARRKNA